MSQTLPRIEGPGDAELISAVRGGDLDAYGDLFERHVGAARALARQLVSSGDADDLVSDAFAKVLGVLQRGGGPDLAFRAYLLTAVRRLHIDKIRASSKIHTTDDMEKFDPGTPFRDTAIEGFENAAAAAAFASLPERWQLVLWHTEVEGQKPAEVGALLGMSANAVSALAYRAREGLRQAYLNSHATELDDANCQWTHNHLGAYVRNGVSKRDAVKIEDHLDECRQCMAIYLELTEVNSNLGAILAPLLLGGAATAYVASVGGASSGGIMAVFGNLKAQVNPVIAGVAAATVAAAGIAAGTVLVTVNSDQGRVDSPPVAGQGSNGDGGGDASGGDTSSGDTTTEPAPVTPPESTDKPEQTATPKPNPTPTPTPEATAPVVVGLEPARAPNKPRSFPAGGGDASPNPDAAAEPTKPSRPPKPPPPPPPPPPIFDLKFGTPNFTAPNGPGDAWKVHVPVAGLAPKATATVTINGLWWRLNFRTLDPSCASPGVPVKCTISSTHPAIDFTVEPFSGGAMTINFVVSPNGQDQDSDPNNNRATVRLPQRA